MNFFTRFDAGLIEITERCCHKIQRLTGLSNFYLYGVLVFFSGLSLLDIQTNIVFPKTMMHGGFCEWAYLHSPSSYWVVVVTSFIDSIASISLRERKSQERLRSGTANPLKIQALDKTVRVVNEITWLCFVVAMYVGNTMPTSFDLFILSTVVLAGLLAACDPLPPTKGKIREWIGGIRFTRKEIPALRPVRF